MSYTHNEIELESLIDGINKCFYYIGEEGDLVEQHDIDKMDIFFENGNLLFRTHSRDLGAIQPPK